MRLAAITLVCALAGTARAGEPRPEDGVGTWRGRATWKGCTIAGAAQVSIDVTWREGVFHAALAGARDDLGDVALVPRDDGAAAGTHDDLTVTFKPGAPRVNRSDGAAPAAAPSAKLTLATAAGCNATMTLARDGAGIASCDRLLALATIESTCDAGDASHLTDARGKLAGWKKLRGKARATAAEQCTKDGDALADALDANGCFPKNGAISGTGIAECDAYVAALQRFAQCNVLPVDAKQALEQAMSQMTTTWKSLSPEAKQAAADACKQGTDAIRTAAKAQGCQI